MYTEPVFFITAKTELNTTGKKDSPHKGLNTGTTEMDYISKNAHINHYTKTVFDNF